MKILSLSFYFFIVAFTLSAQPFSLFSDGSAKDFAPLSETWERNYSLKIDSVFEGDVISQYFLYTVMNENDGADFVPNDGDPLECFGWGGCNYNSGSTGFGAVVFSPAPFHYHFLTLNEDTLRFNFNADSSVFFQNDESFYVLIYEGTEEQIIFGTTELVGLYRIGHYTTEGAIISSPLHDFQITVGQFTGLIDFFQVDNFPEVEMPLTLFGDENHNQSLTVLTGEMIYDFQVGDTIQLKMTYFQAAPNNPNFIEEIDFLNRIILNRTEDGDSLRYTILHQSFVDGEPGLVEWIQEKAYYRFDTLGVLPFYQRINTGNYHDGSYQMNLFRRDFCGEIRTGIAGISAPYLECTLYNAWCGFDTNGPPEITSYEYVEGLGMYFHEVVRNGFGTFSTWKETTEVVYFSKGGISCGQEAILSVHSGERAGVKFTVYPNPAKDVINLSTSSDLMWQITMVEVYDISGRLVATYLWKGSNTSYNLPNLVSGLYLLELIGNNEVLGVEKFVIE